MREILFKAKRIDNGEWIFGNLLITNDDGACIIQNHIPHHLLKQCKVDKNTICEYTGLTDKNGNRIWENDVVKTYNSQGQECYIEQIIWDDYGLNDGWCSKGIISLIKYDKRVFNTGFGKSDARKCEVIGNIFDNPELLKGGVK